jgi:type III secretion system FlhB-like substrate exporter
MWNFKKLVQEIESRLKNIRSHIPKIIFAGESGIINRVIYYKKEMTLKIWETRKLINHSNKHKEILKFKNELDSIEKEIFLTISKYE